MNGINVGGYLRAGNGVGAAARGYLRALRGLGIPLALQDLSELSGGRLEERAGAASGADLPHDINLLCGDLDVHLAMMAHQGEQFYRNCYNIGVWHWELPRFPEKWYDRFVWYDEIWVASSFIANALSAVAPIPVVRIPPVLTAEQPGSRELGRRHLGVSAEEFVFLFIFDGHSRFPRKNPVGLVDAFRQAFGTTDPVRLVVKCMNAACERENLTALEAQAQGYPVSILTDYWSAQEMRDLMAACDAYVSLHRSEGLGLTVTDAMALGKPVIATGWSGNMDFMNVANSYPVRYQLIDIEKRVAHYEAGETWAAPSLEHAAELMRLVFTHRDEALQRGQTAQREIEANYSEASVGRLVQQRLEVIANRRRFAALKRRLKAPLDDLDRFAADFRDISQFVPISHLRYRQLLGRIRRTVQTVLPADATVLVVSRGDGELLQLDGRRAWHFPQTETGVYAGHNPADSDEAIDHLEALRAKGADFLLLPSTALWWLEHYGQFARHLQEHFAEVGGQRDACVIYALSGPLAAAPCQTSQAGQSGSRHQGVEDV